MSTTSMWQTLMSMLYQNLVNVSSISITLTQNFRTACEIDPLLDLFTTTTKSYIMMIKKKKFMKLLLFNMVNKSSTVFGIKWRQWSPRHIKNQSMHFFLIFYVMKKNLKKNPHQTKNVKMEASLALHDNTDQSTDVHRHRHVTVLASKTNVKQRPQNLF